MRKETESRLDKQQWQRRYAMLGRYENQRAEVIAMHYFRQAEMAKETLGLIRLSRQNPSATVNEAIETLVGEITKNHAADLGIELKWEETP
jgi:hypothetical protein